MWISKQIIKEETQPPTECGTLTMNVNGSIEAASTGLERSIEVYAPFGYKSSIPSGTNLLLSQGGGQQVCIGVKSDAPSLKEGEIKIESPCGGYVYLKADGSVEINGLLITKEGKLVEQKR